MKALLILNDYEMMRDISLCIKQRWPDVTIISTGEGNKGVKLVKAKLPDVILLDLMLLDMNGFEALTRIRAFSDVPVIIVTSREEETDQVRCLEKGADDYMVKPFSCMELAARVRAVMRRCGRDDIAQRINLSQEGLVSTFGSRAKGVKKEITPRIRI